MGCFAAGAVCSRFPIKKVFGTLYASRVFMTLAFFGTSGQRFPLRVAWGKEAANQFVDTLIRLQSLREK